MAIAKERLPAEYPAWQWRQGSDIAGLAAGTIHTAPLAEDDVLVENRVVGLNPVDWKVLGHLPWDAGHVPGVDGAGVVTAVGRAVSAAWLGRRVAYHQSLMRPGSFAAYTPVKVRALMTVPEGLDFATAASFPCPGLTAWQAMSKLPLSVGDTLLIGGAGGAVGHYLVQLAARRGLQVTTLSHARHWSRLKALGAAHCEPGPLPENGLLPEKLQRRFHGVIDAVGERHGGQLVPGLRANGHLVCIQDRLSGWPLPAFAMAISMHEVALGALHTWGDDEDWQRLTQAGEAMLAALADGMLLPESHLVRDFAELPDFLDALKHRHFSGKPLIQLPVDKTQKDLL